MNEFEEFDPTQGEEFEEFDVSAETEAEAEATIESFGGLSDSEDQVKSLLAARDELENRLMGLAGARAAALSDDEPYISSNVVGIGIGEKLTDGVLQPIAPGVLAPAFNMQVQKSGRTTQFRRGFIDLVNTTVDVSYAPLGGVARFVRQFRVRGQGAIFSDRGDSGSLVTTFPQNRPVGLLFAGNAANNMTFCNPIGAVLAAFGVNIVV